MRLLVRPTSRLAVALILLAMLVPPRWSSTPLTAEQPVVDPKVLPKFPPVAASDALNTFQLKKGFRHSYTGIVVNETTGTVPY